MSQIEHQRGRAMHESGTKQARKGYEKDTVWARFFPPSGSTTPAPISACAARKNLFLAQHYRSAKRTHRGTLPPLRASVPPCLRASVPVCLCACVPVLPVCLSASRRLAKRTHHPQRLFMSSCFTSSVASRPNEP